MLLKEKSEKNILPPHSKTNAWVMAKRHTRLNVPIQSECSILSLILESDQESQSLLAPEIWLQK